MSKVCTLLFCLICVASRGITMGQTINESQVFEWWDSGIVSAEEAQEMLDLIQEGNEREACFLAEIYALENCGIQFSPEKSSPQKKSRSKTAKKEDRKVHGRFFFKAQADSLGELSKKRYNLQLDFYRFTLRLGTQELLTYRHKGAEAYFGQISTKELRSHIPLDTLWGTAFFYPIKKFTLGALLDTAHNVQGSLGYSLDKTSFVNATYWYSPSQQSVYLYGKSSWGEIALWSILGRDLLTQPLIKIQLHNREQRVGQTFSWRATAYYHGDSLPEQARLSKTLQKYRFWGTQTLSFVFADLNNTKISASTQVTLPLDADTASAKIKLQSDSGPRFLRMSASATCKDAENSCTSSDYKLQATWRASDHLAAFSDLRSFALQGSVKNEYKRNDGFQRPKLELGAIYNQDEQNLFSITLIIPKANLAEKFQIRNQISMGTEKLHSALGVTFSRIRGQSVSPQRGYIQIRGTF